MWCLQALLAIPDLLGELGSLQDSHVQLGPLLRVVATSLAARLAVGGPAVATYEEPLLQLVRSGLLGQVSDGPHAYMRACACVRACVCMHVCAGFLFLIAVAQSCLALWHSSLTVGLEDPSRF